jgi:CDP-glucose 4,6-dehydratase
MGASYKAFAGKRVFVTGHTGFKGSWLCEWLLGLGSEVYGYSLPPATKPALFNQLGLADRLNHTLGDVRNASELGKAVRAARPHFVFHLAAQPIVREAYAHPSGTWSTNLMGTVNLLEALRQLGGPCAAVIVTTDKVYRPSAHARAEDDPIGALDPYGCSKAAVELAVAAWRQSFFPVSAEGGKGFPMVGLATARAGNVIGGGDWAADRLLPDCVRGLSRRSLVVIRNPSAVRPWQHVLDPLSGYLMLGAELGNALVSGRRTLLVELSGPFNFGPSSRGHRPVREVVTDILRRWPGKWRPAAKSDDPRETRVLRLDARKAKRVLGWEPKWGIAKSVAQTVDWYRGAVSSAKAIQLTRRQIDEYSSI